MLRLSLVTIALLTACVGNQSQKDYYDDVERGSHWQLTFTPPGAASCPAFATKLASVPDGALTHVEAGCTATLTFYAMLDHNPTENVWDVMAELQENCADTSGLLCDADPIGPDVTMYCSWSAAADISKSWGDCNYDAKLVRLD
jgi:hypothetical protein